VDVPQRVAPLYPLQSGRVTRIPAEENDEVEPGQVLLQLDDTMGRLQVEAARVDLRAAEERLAGARSLPEQQQKKVEIQRLAVDVAEDDLKLARVQQERAQRRLDNGVAGNEEEVRSAALLVAKAEAARKVEQAKLAALELVNPRQAVRLAELDVEAKRDQLKKAEKGLEEYRVVAPYKGTVLRINVSEGETLGPNPRQPALMFCAAGPRIIRAEVEQEFAARVAPGQTALIQDDTTGSGSWRGKVARLSDWYTHRRSVLLEPLQYNDVRTLECIIALDPGQPHLRIGQRVRVTLAGPGGS
jgi:multidrug resistance efflux pump